MANLPAMPLRTIASCLMLACFHAHTAWAELPQVDRFFPPGAQRGKTVEIKVTGKMPAGTQIWSDRTDVTFEVKPQDGIVRATVAADATPGRAWIRFYNAEGATSLRPFLIGMLPEINEQEPNDRNEQAQAAASTSVLINGVLQKGGDVDVYSMPLNKDQTVVLSLRANRRLGSPVDAVMQLTTARGFVLAHNDDDHHVDPQITFTAPETATYFVRVFGFPTKPNSTIGFAGNADYIYRLLMTTGAYTDHVMPLAGSMPPQSKVTLRGWNLGETNQTETTLRPDSAGNLIVFHPRVANEIRIPVTPHKLILEQDASIEQGTQSIGIPSVVSGHISPPGDVDTYQFTAKKGQKLSLRCEARVFDSLLDPILKLLDAKGKTLKEADDQSKGMLDCQLSLTIPGDGDYQVVIGDRFQAGGRRFTYRLISEIPRADFKITLAAAEFTLTPGKPLEIPVTILRTNGLAEVISIAAENLPDGVQAQPVKSMPKGDSSKTVKLKLESNRSEPFQGALRIVGHCAARADMPTRVAQFAIANPPHNTSGIWLTVTKPTGADKPPTPDAPKPKQP